MNKIDKLIADLCPNGVELKSIGEICQINRGRVMSKDYLRDNSGEYPVYSSQTIDDGVFGRIKTYDYDGEYLTWTTDGANAGSIFYRKGKFSITNVCGLLKVKDTGVNTKFLLYILATVSKKYVNAGMGNPKIMSNVMEKIKIPIPPLAIQQEIVKILDNFTKLEAELEAELEARKKQYEYYRTELLTFADRQTDRVRWITLNEIGKVSMCKRIFKNETLTSGDIPFYKIGTFGKQPNSYISRKIYDEYRKKYSFPKKGDVLLSASGTIGRRVIYNGEPAYFQDSNIVWIDNDESKVSNKFLYYLYAIIEWRTEGGTIQRLYNDNLKKIQIPVPPLSEQEHIIAILDKFDALVNDISIGLPAELNARRKQYEYYRNQLLTFDYE
jgi:type I restriction enzyme S subunit